MYHTAKQSLASVLRLASLILLVSVSISWAQFTSGIEGTVTDPSQAVVPAATLTLTNTETGGNWTATTTTAGYYRFQSLPAAAFSLTVTAPGFQKTEYKDLRLQVAETRTLNISLAVGTQGSTVTVTGEAPAVETSEGRISGLIESEKIKDLPIAGRNFYGLVVLTPGVTGLPTGGSQAYAQATADVFTPEYGVNLNANGLRSEQNGFTVDSGSVTSMVRHGVTNTVPNSESVQELRISVNNFDAANGGSAGALVSVITKGGSNNYHGSAAFFHTNNHLQARNEFQGGVPVFRRNEGIASFGGPLAKNKTFFFGSVDVQRSGVAPGNVATVFTPDFINWMQQNKPGAISTYVAKTFPAQVTPTGNFKTVAALMNASGCTAGTAITTPAGSMPCDLRVQGDGTFTATIPRNGVQYNGRVDHVLREGDRVYASLFRTQLNDTVNQSVYPGFRSPRTQWTLQANLNETHTFSPHMLNEFSIGFVRLDGLNNCMSCNIPNISITGGPAGYGAIGPIFFVQNNFEYRDTLSWNRGAHTIKVGASLAKLQSNYNPTPYYQRPSYSFSNVWGFVNDSPFSQSNIGYNPSTGSPYVVAVAERQTMVAMFVQDDWKVRPNFTLNWGLRWETFGKVPEATKVTNVVFAGGDTFSSRIANAKTDIVPTIYTHSNLTNFGPRLSFAWDPTRTGRLSIRGGAGIFYDAHSSQVYGGSHFNPPLYALVTASAQTAPVLPVFGLGSATEPYNFPRSPYLTPGLDSKNGLLFGKANVSWVDPSSRDSYSQNYFFGVQYGINPAWTVEADYIGSGGRRLYANFNVNRVTGDLIAHNNIFNGLNTSYGAITYSQSLLNSSYNGGTLSLKKRPTHGILFEAAYTFGKALDYASSFGGNLPIVDMENYRDNRALADFNVGQKLSLAAVWEVPTPHASGFVRGALGGWQMGMVTILQVGTPFRVFCSKPFAPVKDAGTGAIVGNTGCDYNADGFNNDVPDTPAAGNNLGTLSRSNYINGLFTASYFPTPAFGREGNLGRNVFKGPGYANTDFSLYKTVRFHWLWGSDGASMQFRAEAFNLFNRVNLSQVNGDMASAVFGKSTSTFGARDLQFGLRLSF